MFPPHLPPAPPAPAPHPLPGHILGGLEPSPQLTGRAPVLHPHLAGETKKQRWDGRGSRQKKDGFNFMGIYGDMVI